MAVNGYFKCVAFVIRNLDFGLIWINWNGYFYVSRPSRGQKIVPHNLHENDLFLAETTISFQILKEY